MFESPVNDPFAPQLPDAAILGELGERVARTRLRQNLGQVELAARAGVSRATVQRLEAGNSAQLTHLIRILRALGLTQNLGLLVPAPDSSPLEALDRGDKPRQRASRKRNPEGNRGSGWSWGEEP